MKLSLRSLAPVVVRAARAACAACAACASCGEPSSSSAPATATATATATVQSAVGVKPANTPPAVDLSRMVLIPAGTFRMGRASADPGMYGAEWKSNELPQHEVELGAFYIDRDEVTVAAWARFLDAWGDPSALDSHQPIQRTGGQGTPATHVALPGFEDRPIAFVTWFDAVAFCAFFGKSLPTEAEWERAAKGGADARRYPWGDEGPRCSRAVFTGQARCEDALANVGSRSPAGDSPEGVHDLAGNVAEWVMDWYGPYPGAGKVTSPGEPAEGTARVIRGGTASDPPAALRTTARFGSDPTNRSQGVGLRCVHRK